MPGLGGRAHRWAEGRRQATADRDVQHQEHPVVHRLVPGGGEVPLATGTGTGTGT
ncbi:hypothetical protein P3T35_002181 [Kitasatospora sp. GP30]|uniref:hypothetical protein n=1 Tax=Kitasatospora sp. GP30 TaxID=3035084 RepID=UPI0015D5F205|nr:hypothetical protein [Kitasatospora sp. GP30]MDH6140173.1 hypothetical protein [Kitasatospora sp. GP30]